jgi:8-oxo-dGTP pyrophosphatase MutT (NUDIX family)
MNRDFLLVKLTQHRPHDEHERSMRDQIIKFVNEHSDCFERTLLIGHITGSAFIVNKQRTRTLMTHHQKLDKWLQLGGHSDGEWNTLNVALREAQEESGISKITPLSENIFDVDVHLIPERKSEPQHFHYDIRFLCEADENQDLMITNESKDLAWIPLETMEEYTTEESVLRMVRKILHT